ncbi:hypothetical protein FO519_005712 [Halicephalobus sp. NKZ332]|nr:hypothetical protein FO519_005712 [Halicephalobus sp. NKZ332]
MLVKTLMRLGTSKIQLDLVRRTTNSARIKWNDWSPSGLVEKAPIQTRPFLKLIRLDKPTGTFLLFWPAAWGIALATPLGGFPDVKTIAIFASGSFLMRGAACIINDLWDRKYDREVERTKTRPLASGELSTPQAIGLLGFLLTGSLGATINYGAIMGFTAVTNSFIPEVVFPLYFSAIFWTMIYDTIYAHQDKEDDSRIGVKSTALKFQEKTKFWLTGFSAAMISNLGLAGSKMDLSWPFYTSLVLASLQLSWQIWTLNINRREDCWKKFNSNQWIGVLMLTGILAGTMI